MTKIEMQVGDKVIRADGLSGKITAVFGDRTDEKSPIAKISYENGDTAMIGKTDEQNDFNTFYLIGTTVIGNKVSVKCIDEDILDVKHSLSTYRKTLARIKQELIHVQEVVERMEKADKQLRKQKWRLETQMNDEYIAQNPKTED
nr:MAG TPA: hypothetical protein [Caudoviricetes sp.]